MRVTDLAPTPKVTRMDTETPKEPPRDHGSNAFIIFITSLSAAIVVAGGFGIVFEAAIIAAANLFGLGQMFIWVCSAANAAATLWLALWTFARSWRLSRSWRRGSKSVSRSSSVAFNRNSSLYCVRSRAGLANNNFVRHPSMTVPVRSTQPRARGTAGPSHPRSRRSPGLCA